MYRAVLPVCRYYICLRYTLLQLFYDAMFENTLNGMPICRPLFVTDPQDKALFNDRAEFLDNEFMVGSDLLIAPVVYKQSAENGYGKRDIYLPAGSRWYQFKNKSQPLGSALEGGTNVAGFDAHISDDGGHILFILPMYVREGAVLPTVGLEQYVGERWEKGQANPITLNIYPGQKGSYTMYLDDGVNRSSQPEEMRELGIDPEARGEYRQVEITHQWKDEKTRTVSVKRVHDGYTPKYEKYFYVALRHAEGEKDHSVSAVKINEEAIEERTVYGSCEEAQGSGWFYDSTARITYIKVVDDAAEIDVEARDPLNLRYRL